MAAVRCGSSPVRERLRKLVPGGTVAVRREISSMAASRGVTTVKSIVRPRPSVSRAGCQLNPSLAPIGLPTKPLSTTWSSAVLRVYFFPASSTSRV